MDARQCDEDVSLERQWLTEGTQEPATEGTAAETAANRAAILQVHEVKRGDLEMNGAV